MFWFSKFMFPLRDILKDVSDEWHFLNSFSEFRKLGNWHNFSSNSNFFIFAKTKKKLTDLNKKTKITNFIERKKFSLRWNFISQRHSYCQREERFWVGMNARHVAWESKKEESRCRCPLQPFILSRSISSSLDIEINNSPFRVTNTLVTACYSSSIVIAPISTNRFWNSKNFWMSRDNVLHLFQSFALYLDR